MRIAAAIVLAGASLYWFYEAATCGFCTFSRYGAPFIILANLVLALTHHRKATPPK